MACDELRSVGLEVSMLKATQAAAAVAGAAAAAGAGL